MLGCWQRDTCTTQLSRRSLTSSISCRFRFLTSAPPALLACVTLNALAAPLAWLVAAAEGWACVDEEACSAFDSGTAFAAAGGIPFRIDWISGLSDDDDDIVRALELPDVKGSPGTEGIVEGDVSARAATYGAERGSAVDRATSVSGTCSDTPAKLTTTSLAACAVVP